MFYKLIFGLSLVASLIVIIENLAVWASGWYLLIFQVYTWSLSFFSVLMWMWIWFGLAWIIMKKKDDDDNYDY
jgi:hypothetical protein